MGLLDYFKNKREYEEDSAMMDLQAAGVMKVLQVAAQLNIAHNTRNFSVAGELCSVLYNEVSPRKQGGKVLISLSSDDCQCIGMAFTTMALCYNFNDEDINSVAAENAYYCLARNLIETDNSFVAPALYTLMQKGAKLMEDKLISSWCHMAQEQTGMPIGLMLGGNPYTDPKLNDFRQQAINFKNHIAFYALKLFYDIVERQYKIPTDLPYYIPNEKDINSFLIRIESDPSFKSNDIDNNCREHFISVYEQCKDTLLKF